jgi:colanic acid biosynthesis glycosyl transferase WcaI
MKILFLTENFPPETNAAATRVFERACYWVNWGHEVTILTSAPNFPQGKLHAGYENAWKSVESRGGMRVVRVKTYISANEGFLRRTFDFVSFMCTAFFFGLFEKKPDLVIATSPQFFAAVGGWALAAARGVPFIFELGDLWPKSILAVGAMKKSLLVTLLEKLELFLYRRSKAVVALTHAFKADLIRRGIPSEKIAVVVNGVDLPRYAPRPKSESLASEWGLSGKFTIGYVGTHGMAHGLINVLEAAELLRDRSDIRFLFVGAGAERDMLMEEAKKRNLANVIFQPSQPKERMPEIWSLCEVALVHLKDSPTFAEVIPSKIFEAMGMGLPVLLVAPEGEASRIIIADQAGPWVPAGQPDKLAEAACLLADQSEVRQKFAASSLASAPLHSREHQASEMLKVLELVKAGRGNEAGAIEP